MSMTQRGRQTPVTATLRAAGGRPDTFTASTAGPFGCFPCWDCSTRPAEGAVVWQNRYGDLYCDPCAQRRMVQTPAQGAA